MKRGKRDGVVAPPYAAYTTASYTTTASATAAPYTTGAYTTSTYITSAREPRHARQLSEESEDPLAVIDPAAGTTDASTRQTQVRHVRFGSHGSESSWWLVCSRLHHQSWHSPCSQSVFRSTPTISASEPNPSFSVPEMRGSRYANVATNLRLVYWMPRYPSGPTSRQVR